MHEKIERSHWIFAIARDARVVSADAPSLDADTPVVDAWRAVAQLGGITQAQLAEIVAAHFHMQVADFSNAQLHVGTLLPEKLARERLAFPLRETDREIVVAVADPTDMEAEQLISFASGRATHLVIAPPGDIQDALDARYAPDRAVERLLNRVGAEMANAVRVVHESAPESVQARDAAAAPIVKLTNVILADAVHARASDIHLEPSGDGGRVRFRVDGVLQPYTRVSMPILNRVVSCIKIMGNMDIADRLRPQDGRARISIDDRSIDLRLSTVPTRESEKAVVRLLDPLNARRLEDLSLTTTELEPLRSLMAHCDGIVLVTGPTGSGKTTLLYAALREMPAGELNVMTVEDPIEYELPGLTQIQVEPKRDVTFANALRSILRQDPDVIFIGEIRDAETAAIAVQASLTGHLVLALLHTNDAVGAIGRFADLGVERGEIASTLRGASAQRLVRKICAKCALRIDGPLTESEKRLAVRYNVQPVVRATGCPACSHTGYYGRIPLLEILVASAAFERGIIEAHTALQLQSTAIANGMRPLRAAAASRVRNGETTLEEIDRELGESDPLEAVIPSASRHIVVADDDSVVRGTARAVLESNGFRVTEATDGVEALEKIASSRDVSMLVLDLSMPRMNGQEVVRQLKGSVATASLPVVVLTGSTDDKTEVALMEAGADDYVRKPFEADRFLARIRAVLRRASAPIE